MTLTGLNLWPEKTILELFANLLIRLAIYFQSELCCWIKTCSQITASSFLPSLHVQVAFYDHEESRITLKTADMPVLCWFCGFIFLHMAGTLVIFLPSQVMPLSFSFPFKAANSPSRKHQEISTPELRLSQILQ